MEISQKFSAQSSLFPHMHLKSFRLHSPPFTFKEGGEKASAAPFLQKTAPFAQTGIPHFL